MKRHAHSTFTRSTLQTINSRPRAFTLVELLVVITIIGILAGLITAAAIRARITAKNMAVSMELSQLEMALQSYKEKFGEYPPDFAGINDPDAVIAQAAEDAVMRHIRKAFPRYTGTWADILTATGLVKPDLTPQTALAFWLGGMRDTTGKPVGFSANPANPFEIVSTSRIKPFYDFDLNRLGGVPASNAFLYRYWPKEAVDTSGNGAIAYFRAENGRYTCDGQPAHQDLSNVKNVGSVIWPAVDSQRSDSDPYPDPPVFSWVNAQSVQLFSSGLDKMYSASIPMGPLMFPSGSNYDPVGFTYDDITNFSGGTLEDAMP